MSDSESTAPAAPLRQRGPALLLLTVPGILFCLAPFVANRIEPRILGIPFLIAYLIAVTVLTGPLIWLAAHFDPAYRSGAAEFVPADDISVAPTDAASGPADPATGAQVQDPDANSAYPESPGPGADLPEDLR
ncbi:DUF3311 domain-containing protein [Nocardia concava]|uniref:DUF3311 domain-containing protein n=1 Tax=Nocardia concava TaxID=257281 RepID=UPI0002F90934|nr:DUF3311 domain-containing protein [Nocardia concava]